MQTCVWYWSIRESPVFVRTLAAVCGDPPLLTSRLTTSRLLWCTATWSGVRPFCEGKKTKPLIWNVPYCFRLHPHSVVFVTFPAAFGLAPLSNNSSATSTFPYLEATCSGVKPFCRSTKRTVRARNTTLNTTMSGQTDKLKQRCFTLVILVCWASMSNRIRTVCTWPSLAAMCRGVWPAVVVAFGLALWSSSSFTNSLWPIRAAQWRGVWSSWSGRKWCLFRLSLIDQLLS